MEILRTMPVLPEIPPIGDWLRAQSITITADQNPSYAGEIFDPDRFPVVARLVFQFFETAGAHELFCMKPVQSTFTTHVWFALCHAFIFRPCTAILVMHTRQEVRKKKKDTYSPIIKAIPELSSSDRVDGTETTAEEFRFERSTLYVGGGQSASVLTSTAANIVILDECEQHKTVGDTTTISLARGRITAGNEWRKLCAFSKPEKEARFEKNAKTGILEYQPEEGTYMHAEYLSGNQLHYECPCPACGVFTEPQFRGQIVFTHCRIPTLAGMPLQWDKDRILGETYWQCPHCPDGRVHEGDEKKAWVLAGRWAETPRDQRKAREKYPEPHPGRWSAQFSALTDIAFDSLTWGNIALRFIDAENDPVKLRAFNNELLGKAEPRIRSEDTTLDHLRRLIPGPASKDPPPWRMRDENDNLTRIIPCPAFQMDYIGMIVDTQKEVLKYRVRAHAKDGRSFLLDYGKFPSSPDFLELKQYLDTQQFTTLDGVTRGIRMCYIDVGGTRYFDVIDLCIANHPRIQGIKGSAPNLESNDRAWPQKVNAKSGRGHYIHFIEHRHWARHLYVDRIQHHDPRRHRPHAPALYFPTDIGDDYLVELTQEHEVSKGRKTYWEKVSMHAVNDNGDLEKYGLVMDYNLGIRFKDKGKKHAAPSEPHEPPVNDLTLATEGAAKKP